MRIVLTCLAGLLTACSLTSCAAPPATPTPGPPAELGTSAASDLQRRLASGEADPVADAKRAAKLGDFRFVWAIGLGFRAPMGLTCNAMFHPSAGQALVTRSISDTVPDGCEHARGACEFQ